MGAVTAVFPVLFNNIYGMHTAAQYSWFIGCGVGLGAYLLLAKDSGDKGSGTQAQQSTAVVTTTVTPTQDTPVQTTPTVSSPPAGSDPCDNSVGIEVGSPTSCAFAANVRSAYLGL